MQLLTTVRHFVRDDVLHEFHKVSALEVPKCFESESITSVASCSPYLCNSEDESNNEGKCKGNISN